MILKAAQHLEVDKHIVLTYRAVPGDVEFAEDFIKSVRRGWLFRCLDALTWRDVVEDVVDELYRFALGEHAVTVFVVFVPYLDN